MSVLYSVDSLKFILRSEKGHQAFMAFLEEEHAEENLQFYDAIERLARPCSKMNIEKEAMAIVREFLEVGSEKEVNLSSALRRDLIGQLTKARVADDVTSTHLQSSLQKAQQDILAIMALGPYPRFLKSAQYKRWKKFAETQALLEDTADTSTACSSSCDGNDSDDDDVQRPRGKLTRALPLGKGIGITRYPAEEIRPCEESNQRIEPESWVAKFTATADNLPVAISIASAQRQGFPWIFVNKMFVKMTGYEAHEVVGQNYRFFPRPDTTEATEMRAFSQALKEARPYTILLTSCRKNGDTFRNMLTTKPIFDQVGRYQYVVVMQFEVTASTVDHMMKMAHSLADMLPTECFMYAADK